MHNQFSKKNWIVIGTDLCKKSGSEPSWKFLVRLLWPRSCGIK